jgi:hypothetical protein
MRRCTDLSFLSFYLREFDVLVNHDGPRRRILIIATEVVAFLGKVPKASPLIECDATVVLGRFQESTKTIEAVHRYAIRILQDKLQQHDHQFLVNGLMGTFSIELKAKL